MDRVIRGILNGGKVRIFLADTSITSKKICKIQSEHPIVSDILSRLISVGAIMGAMQKDGKLTIKMETAGLLKSIVIDANYKGDIRALVNSVDIPLEENDFDKIVANGLGFLSVAKDLGLKHNFSSQVLLQSGKIGDDFTHYFKESEQVDSVVSVGTIINEKEFKSGALIIQLMPGADDVDYRYIEGLVYQLPNMKEILRVKDLNAALIELFPEIEILGESPVRFKCNCSKSRYRNSLKLLSTAELKNILNDDKDEAIEATCSFCYKHYTFTKEEIRKIIEEKEKN